MMKHHSHINSVFKIRIFWLHNFINITVAFTLQLLHRIPLLKNYSAIWGNENVFLYKSSSNACMCSISLKYQHNIDRSQRIQGLLWRWFIWRGRYFRWNTKLEVLQAELLKNRLIAIEILVIFGFRNKNDVFYWLLYECNCDYIWIRLYN